MNRDRPSASDDVYDSHRIDRREDVADQPGLSRSLFGIGVAVFCGLLIRGAFSEDMISAHVRKAAERIHGNISVEFDRAGLSLADGPFPEFAIVVEGVRLASPELCWLSPLAEVNQLRLPVDFWSLLRGRVEIREVKLGQVNLQLRTSPDACRPSSAVESKNSPAPQPSPSLLPPPRSRGPITRVSVYNLQIHYLPLPFTSFDVSRLQIDRTGEDPLSLRAQGEVNLGGATLSGDYSSRARVVIDYRHPEVRAEVAGTWREGTYNLQLESNVQEKSIGAEGRIDHLPLSQILPVLTKYHLLEGEYDGRQVWLNLKFKTPHRRTWEKGLPLRVDHFGLEGDLGQIEAGGFDVQRWDPLEFSNTEILLRGLQVEKLMRLFGRSEKSKSLGSLGELNGLLKVQGNRRFELTGEYSGLELIFSNGRERKTQVISLMTGILKADHDLWSLHIDRIRAADALIIGQISANGDLASRRLSAKVQIEEASLSPEIQTMMTNGGSLGRWAADLEGRWENSILQNLRGQLIAQDLLVEGVRLSQLRTSVHADRGHDLGLDFRATQFSVQENSRLRSILSPLASSVGQGFQGVWTADQLQLSLDFLPQDQVRWKLKPTHFNGWQLRSEGGWDPAGQLRAQIQVRAREKESRWKIEGVREAPVFVEEK